MSAEPMDTWLSYFVIDVIVKMTLLLLFIVLVDKFATNRSAAFRHRIWAFAFLAIGLLPLASFCVPELRLAVVPPNWLESANLSIEPMANDRVSETRLMPTREYSNPEQPSISRTDQVDLGTYPIGKTLDKSLLPFPRHLNPSMHQPIPLAPTNATEFRLGLSIFMSWLIGACVALVPLLLGVWKTLCLQHASRVIEQQNARQMFADLRSKMSVLRVVKFLESGHASVPMTWGVFYPVVVLPNEWRKWPIDRTRLVVLHELAHVARLDVFYQTMARVVCSAFWFHPLVWYALKRLRVERELACDDCVVMAGELPSHYAFQLVSIAREYQSSVYPPAVAMAQRSGLEIRVRAILDQARSHSPLTRNVAVAMVMFSLIAVLTLAPIRLGTNITTLASDDAKELISNTSPTSDTAKMLKLEGIVLGPDGQPLEKARVVVLRCFNSNSSWLNDFEIMSQGLTDRSGTYQFEVSAKSSRFANSRHFEAQSIRIYASKDGFGSDEVQWDPNLSMQSLHLVSAKHTIDGRVVDLEGKPVAGVRVRVIEIDIPAMSIETWIEQAKNNPPTLGNDPMQMQSGSRASTRPKVAYFPSKDSILALKAVESLEAVSALDGSFRLSGVGDGRQATLEFVSDKIATSWAKCVVHDMQPVNMPSSDPRYRFGKTFGRRFEYSCEPSQWIQGVVRDRVTGSPLPGVTVSLSQFADNLLQIEGFIDAVTDSNGHYVLKGIPKASNASRGVRLTFTPNLDQPYFRFDKLVPKISTLDPIEFNVQMTKGVWLEGQVKEVKSKQPIRAMAAYYPHRSNHQAKVHEAWDDGILSMGYGDMLPTDDQGRFRIPAMSGPGVVRIVAENNSEYAMVPSEEANNSKQNLNEKYYRISMPGNALVEVDIPENKLSTSIDIEISRLPARAIHVVDMEGKDVTGYLVAGRLPTGRPTLSGRGPAYWDPQPMESAISHVITGHAVERQRPLVLYEPSQQIGAVVSVASLGNVEGSPHRVILKPCAILTGKLVDNQGKAVRGNLFAGIETNEVHSIETVLGQPKMSSTTYPKYPTLKYPKFHDDGSFECMVPPGKGYSLVLTGERNIVLLEDRELLPGQKIDMGTIDITQDPKRWPKAIISERERANRALPVSSTISLVNQVENAGGTPSPIYRGRVMLPNGKPANGAALFFVHYSFGRVPEKSILPVATTDASGAFEIRSIPSNDQETSPEQMGLASVLDGYGVAAAPAILFVTAGYTIRPEIAEGLKRYREQTGGVATLQLVDDLPLTGRVLSTEGRPLENVQVRVESVASGLSNLDNWETAAAESKADYYSLARHAEIIMNGYQLPSIVKDATTDREGRFAIRGIGRERVAGLLVSGRNVETMKVHARTRAGKTVRVPHQFGMSGLPEEVFYPASFDLVVLPSVPVVGRIVDATSAKPLAGFLVSAGRLVTFAKVGKPHVATTTDHDGNYRLDGLSGTVEEQIYVVPPKGSKYLPSSVRVRLQSGSDKIVHDFKLTPSIVLRGRVTDSTNKLPIQGAVQYFAMTDNRHLIDHVGFPYSNFHECRTDEHGNYVIAALPGEGVITFRPDDHKKYRHFDRKNSQIGDVRGTSDDAREMYATAPAWVNPADFHYVKKLTLDPKSPEAELSFELASGSSFEATVKLSNGETASGALLKGVSDRSGWYPTQSGKIMIEGYYADQGRELLAFDPSTEQVARVQVSGVPQGEVVVQLKPSGIIRGRLVDKQGVAMESVRLICDTIPTDSSNNPKLRYTTDKEGRFEIRGVLLDFPHTVWAVTESYGTMPIAKEISVDSAKGIDLGEIKFVPD